MHAACYNGLVHYMNFKKEKERVLRVKILVSMDYPGGVLDLWSEGINSSCESLCTPP